MTTPPASDGIAVTRFAPSPTGLLHVGHARAALVAREAAGAGGKFLLRIEDIDQGRCRPEFTTAIFEDLARNLIEPRRLGMATVLVLPPGTREVFVAEWDLEKGPEPAAHYMTENLAGFLRAVAEVMGSG